MKKLKYQIQTWSLGKEHANKWVIVRYYVMAGDKGEIKLYVPLAPTHRPGEYYFKLDNLSINEIKVPEFNFKKWWQFWK